jgi:hypothetical protein
MDLDYCRLEQGNKLWCSRIPNDNFFAALLAAGFCFMVFAFSPTSLCDLYRIVRTEGTPGLQKGARKRGKSPFSRRDYAPNSQGQEGPAPRETPKYAHGRPFVSYTSRNGCG